MEPDGNNEDNTEEIVQQNIAKWQYVEEPLAPLSKEQMNSVHKIEDCVQNMFYVQNQTTTSDAVDTVVHTENDFIKWMVKVENQLKDDTSTYHEKLKSQSQGCSQLFNLTNDVISALHELETKYEQVTMKTNSMHVLSEELKRHQNELITRKESMQERLHYFLLYTSLYDNINLQQVPINSKEYCSILDDIEKALTYLNNHQNFREAYLYRIKYENLLATALHNVLKLFNEVITIDSAFSFYYGTLQNAANKVSIITSHIEEKYDGNDIYKRTLIDCQKAYFSQRWPVMTTSVLKALIDLKTKHKNNHSILFRSAVVFVIKVCHDEAGCFHYFFNKRSPQIEEYLGSLCQQLYDALRPCLSSINHLEVLTELCTILKKILHDKIQNNSSNVLQVALDQLVDTVKQLVKDVEERLVLRAKVFIQYDLLKYEPSPGDLAYPEKLEEMKNIAEEISERRSDSGASAVSVDLQEAVNLNTTYLDSPADLHGMWYPTVKRTLVCLSRLYFCLDKEIFQGLAHEALIICMETIASASNKITFQKSIIDGKLFQIKHLLIIREQIAPFQVDFTTKESVGLLQKSFSSNNALLEYLLGESPNVIDSRKEIDKQLKASCDEFISRISSILIGNDLLEWINKAQHILEIINSAQERHVTLILKEQDFARPQNIATIITHVKRHLKLKIPDIKRSMKLYLANKETEFILFKLIKGNILNAFKQLKDILAIDEYTDEERLMINCPTTEQLNILFCSVSLTADRDRPGPSRASQSTKNSDVSKQ